MASTIHVNAGTGIDTRSFAKFARALRKTAPDLAKELATRLRAAGMVVAHAAQENALPSAQIPPTVKVRVSAVTTKIVAGGPAIAGLWELGNKGGSGAEFTHPVFGNRAVWVKQPTHPFLRPAMEDHADEARASVLEGLDAVIARVVELTEL